MNEKKKSGRKELIERYLLEHSDFFGSHEERTVFLLGLLTNVLLDAQVERFELESRMEAPFRKQLKGLNLGYKDLEKLFPKIEDRLSIYSEYCKYGDYSFLKEMIVNDWSQSKRPFNLSSNEISFLFTMGLHSGLLYKSTKENNDK